MVSPPPRNEQVVKTKVIDASYRTFFSLSSPVANAITGGPRLVLLSMPTPNVRSKPMFSPFHPSITRAGAAMHALPQQVTDRMRRCPVDTSHIPNSPQHGGSRTKSLMTNCVSDTPATRPIGKISFSAGSYLSVNT